MKAGRDERKLNEQAGIPAYMQISSKDVGDIFGSFANIFSSVWSSIKLLSNTLALNLKVIAYTAVKDQKRIREVFSEFATKRAVYDSEMKENLKYFRQNYSASRLDTLGGWGPGLLAFAANPFMFAANLVASDEAAETSIPDDVNPSVGRENKKPVSKLMSDRLKKAMEFFGFDIKRNLSEAVQSSAQKTAPDEAKLVEQAKEQAYLLKKAKEMLTAETRHAHELLAMLAGRPAVIRKIVEAKDFEEMIAAAAEGEKIKMDLSPQAFRTSYKNIVAALKKESQDDPEKFKKSVEDMRAKNPEITEKDDIKAMTAFIFGTAKASIQSQATQSYNGLVNQAEAAMQFPDEKTKKQLMTSDVGKRYLAMLAEFKNNLESGRQEMSAIAAKKV